MCNMFWSFLKLSTRTGLCPCYPTSESNIWRLHIDMFPCPVPCLMENSTTFKRYHPSGKRCQSSVPNQTAHKAGRSLPAPKSTYSLSLPLLRRGKKRVVSVTGRNLWRSDARAAVAKTMRENRPSQGRPSHSGEHTYITSTKVGSLKSSESRELVCKIVSSISE